MNDTGLQGVSSGDIVTIAREAGRLILEVKAGRRLDSRAKEDASPVTAADIAASQHICAALARLSPAIPVISEELPVAPSFAAGTYWLVDPLDGTREFVQGSGEYTVNIALIRDLRPVFGVVVIPETGMAYAGGDHCQAGEAAPNSKVNPIRTRSFDARAPRCLLSRSHRSDEESLLKKLIPTVEVRHAGSSLKYTGIARGDADFSIRKTPTSIWDTAAAHAVLRAAGGDIVGFEGQPLVYDPAHLRNPPFLAFGDRSADWTSLLGLLRQL
jgi:3'(2'), 5'-bisphosphate nucleotidase